MASNIINTMKRTFTTMILPLAMGVAATTAVQAGAGAIYEAAAAGAGVMDTAATGINQLSRAKSLLDHSPNGRALQAVGEDMPSSTGSTTGLTISPVMPMPIAEDNLAPSTWSPTSSPTSAPTSSAPDGNDDADDGSVATCLAELMGCMEDESCSECLNGASGDPCETSGPTCSETVDVYCCMYGDTCNANALLVSYVDCTLNESGCTVESDLCDPEDDNGTPVGNRVTSSEDGDDDGFSDACRDELNSCREDETCGACFSSAVVDGTCDRDAADCDDVASYYCCLVGGTEGCRDNPLLLEYVNCGIELDSCTLTDVCQDPEAAPDNGSDDEGSVPDAPADGENDGEDGNNDGSGAAGTFFFFGSSGGGGASVIGAAAAVVGGFLAINAPDNLLI